MPVGNRFGRGDISPATADAFLNTEYPVAVLFRGGETTMSLVYIILSVRSNDDSIVWDGAAWLQPLAIFFKREQDRVALCELLVEYFTFEEVTEYGTLIAKWKRRSD